MRSCFIWNINEFRFWLWVRRWFLSDHKKWSEAKNFAALHVVKNNFWVSKVRLANDITPFFSQFKLYKSLGNGGHLRLKGW